MATPALVLKDVVKSYGRQCALDSLSVTIPRGAVCGLVGPNGAGKTTTFGIIGGYIRPDSGTISVLGSGPFRTATHSGHVTLLPQDCELSPHMPVRELLIHLARLQQLTRREAERDADRVLDLVDLSDRGGSRIRQLSHGMRRRVAVAQAFLGDPQLILLDEPTAGLDPSQVVRLRELFKAQQGQRTLVISSHILAELEAACDHVVLMEQGRCVRAGRMSEVTARRALVRIRFQGTPPLDRLRTLLPDAAIHINGDELIITARDATSSAAINRLALPVLLDADIDIYEVHRGQSLEAAFLAEQATLTPTPAPAPAPRPVPTLLTAPQTEETEELYLADEEATVLLRASDVLAALDDD
ncbi:MAG: ABC-2 type transport system ATP-binding protein [Myxococcota bacterium]|jgi:ABC-2 type transport system ATP-binding protein